MRGTERMERVNIIEYRALEAREINRELFDAFIRRQVVTKCWRREGGKWVIRDDPFIDDWTSQDYETLIAGLKETLLAGGLVYGAFDAGKLKGFAAVAPAIFGGENRYMDLTELHVSADRRHQGVGRALFQAAGQWAREHGAKKLYISAHSAVESQAFYRQMGCVEAKAYEQRHVEVEPFDCQLEVTL